MLYEEIRAASIAAGYPATDDYHGGQTEGFQRSEMTVVGGRRGSAARVFLKPAMQRRNLHVQTRTLVNRIRIQDGRALGVDYRRGAETLTALADREVIVAAGVYGSPQLLMLSGVGPVDRLTSVGIAPQVDLPGVGKNLIEHPFMFVGWNMRAGAFRSELRADRATVWVLLWALFGRGLFATNGAAGNLFIRTDPRLDRPDMQFTCMCGEVAARELWFPLLGKTPPHTLGVGLSMIKQDSRGEMWLRSADARDPPRIQFNLFKERVRDVTARSAASRRSATSMGGNRCAASPAMKFCRAQPRSRTPISNSSCATPVRSLNMRWAPAKWGSRPMISRWWTRH